MQFLLEILLPNIEGSNRVILLDNLSAHHNANTLEMLRASGHEVVFRPSHSSDLGSIELANNVVNPKP
jgi:transposase